MTETSTDAHDPNAVGDKRLVVAISSRALFDLGDSHALFEREGLDAYRAFQIEHEDDILKPGVAFPLVQKLLGLNRLAGDVPPVEVILLSRNSGDTGLRIFNAIQHYGLEISRAAFTSGAPDVRLHRAVHGRLVPVGQRRGCGSRTGRRGSGGHHSAQRCARRGPANSCASPSMAMR